MIADENGSFLTQRQLPKMVLIKLKIEGDYLVLSGDKMNDIKVQIDPSNDKIKCR